MCNLLKIYHHFLWTLSEQLGHVLHWHCSPEGSKSGTRQQSSLSLFFGRYPNKLRKQDHHLYSLHSSRNGSHSDGTVAMELDGINCPFFCCRTWHPPYLSLSLLPLCVEDEACPWERGRSVLIWLHPPTSTPPQAQREERLLSLLRILHIQGDSIDWRPQYMVWYFIQRTEIVRWQQVFFQTFNYPPPVS